MNERIRQLAGQALDKAVPYTWTRLDYDEIQKLQEYFAELMIQECVGIVEDYGLSLVGSDENYLGETLNLSIRVQEAGNKIKEHFGVEE